MSRPLYGSIVYTELGFGLTAHSGIYVGNDEIIHLTGDGDIELTDFKGFTSNITTFNHEIYVPHHHDIDIVICFAWAAERALKMKGKKRKYDLILDNCHQFCAGCITGDFNNSYNFLWMLKELVCKQHGDKVKWKKWDWKK